MLVWQPREEHRLTEEHSRTTNFTYRGGTERDGGRKRYTVRFRMKWKAVLTFEDLRTGLRLRPRYERYVGRFDPRLIPRKECLMGQSA